MKLKMKQQISLKNAGIKLLALDMDGTLLTEDGQITYASIEAIKKAQQAGISVIIATGRDYNAIPWEQLRDVKVPYVVTNNGSAVYRTKDHTCIYEECIPTEQAEKIISYLLTKHVYMEVFMDDAPYTSQQMRQIVRELPLPEHIIKLIEEKQKALPDMLEYVRRGAHVQKGTLYFVRCQDGSLFEREEVREFLERCDSLSVVNGGYDDLEFMKAGVNKSSGLHYICKILQISPEETAAIGDSENDVEMLLAARLGIAMGNALEDVKSRADAVTLSNEEDGVAVAIDAILAEMP